MLYKLLVVLHTNLVEKKPSMSLLSTESSSGSEKGSHDQQTIPELLSKMFSAKAAQLNLENTTKNPMTPNFRQGM